LIDGEEVGGGERGSGGLQTKEESQHEKGDRPEGQRNTHPGAYQDSNSMRYGGEDKSTTKGKVKYYINRKGRGRGTERTNKDGVEKNSKKRRQPNEKMDLGDLFGKSVKKTKHWITKGRGPYE